MRQIIRKDESQISSKILDYRDAIRRVNLLLAAFTDAGYNLTDQQAQALVDATFSENSLMKYAESITTSTLPVQKIKEAQDVFSHLKALILKAIPGWNLAYVPLAMVKVKNLKGVEDAKVIKQIEDGYTVFAEGMALEILEHAQRIEKEFNELMPKLRRNIFNRGLDPKHLISENDNYVVKFNMNLVNFTDLS